MKSSDTHKHIRINKNVYSVNLRKTDGRYWDCGTAWGPNPIAAAHEYHTYLSNHSDEPKTVTELHKNENDFIAAKEG